MAQWGGGKGERREEGAKADQWSGSRIPKEKALDSFTSSCNSSPTSAFD